MVPFNTMHRLKLVRQLPWESTVFQANQMHKKNRQDTSGLLDGLYMSYSAMVPGIQLEPAWDFVYGTGPD